VVLVRFEEVARPAREIARRMRGHVKLNQYRSGLGVLLSNDDEFHLLLSLAVMSAPERRRRRDAEPEEAKRAQPRRH